MFELNLHKRSISGSSLEVMHSSPMTVPGSARQMTPYNVPPPSTDLPAGTIPDTPGPMQRAFNRDPANHVPWQNASPTPLERYAPSTPVLTPLPGTNLTVGDLDPELVPLPPSINSSLAQIGQGNPGYFDIPVEEQLPMDNADMLNGLACLKLAEDPGDTGDSETKVSHDSGPHTPVGRYGNSEEMRREYKDAKLQDTVCTQGHLKHQALEPRPKQQAKELSDTVRAPNVPQHHQVLPLRPKQQGEDLQDRVRKDSVISKDWETSNGEHSTGTMSEDTDARRTPSQSYKTILPADSTAPASSGHCKRMEVRSSPPVDFAYIVWDSPNESRRNAAQENIWGRHAGLYDGSGYGDDASGPTSCESNEGTKDVHIESGPRSIEPSMTALSADGDRSGKDISNRPSKGEDPYPGYVRESPLTVHKQRNYESLESIYHAYAYPFGERVSSSSNNSTGGDVQRPAAKETEISS
ncbi:hypothetical protein BU25DRAFT_406971 [Macroventuria anomochaeta]|uniref:Uncharacterized protein n=1 Tax=Macroventuria anomochaeta TaxID=301207 RepID=A0ACB6SFR3_9PLEO|nr:uncharacterized protein BU25DRAFT_406971 [Macroventuria anomochaeta]KAF2632440.1 hypothetical protein BU25DRAFT_406971 [Macroventuria anomochaeta]